MNEVSRRLREALVSAYPVHLRARLGDEVVSAMSDVVAAGSDWLGSALDELLGQPFGQQRRGPLEVFQEAMRFPTEHLASRGWPSASRDEVTVSALPGDVYDLAPASTRELGEQVWRCHVAWGATKAAVMRTPPADSL